MLGGDSTKVLGDHEHRCSVLAFFFLIHEFLAQMEFYHNSFKHTSVPNGHLGDGWTETGSESLPRSNKLLHYTKNKYKKWCEGPLTVFAIKPVSTVQSIASSD